MKRMLAVAALTMAASSLALGQMTSKKANANQKVDSVEQAVTQMEEELRVAISKGDTKAYARLVGDDYVFTNHDAVIRTKAQMVSAYDSGSIKYESVMFDEIKVHVYGDTAVVTGRNTAKGLDNGKDIGGQFRYTRVYVKRQGKWQLVATQATRIPAP
ncbi:MAG TPA: nuclear transport factor 2 family protein [Pyrinomonadaceae bacterium]|nr:nuclear transport factor 2 family protein [Pyrinomonadaceae bacterium]